MNRYKKWKINSHDLIISSPFIHITVLRNLSNCGTPQLKYIEGCQLSTNRDTPCPQNTSLRDGCRVISTWTRARVWGMVSILLLCWVEIYIYYEYMSRFLNLRYIHIYSIQYLLIHPLKMSISSVIVINGQDEPVFYESLDVNVFFLHSPSKSLKTDSQKSWSWNLKSTKNSAAVLTSGIERTDLVKESC